MTRGEHTAFARRLETGGRGAALVAVEFWYHLGRLGARAAPPGRFAHAYRLGLRTARLKIVACLKNGKGRSVSDPYPTGRPELRRTPRSEEVRP
jgi:hypothetical protein